MTHNELFYELEHNIDYKKCGFDVDYIVKIYDDEKIVRLIFQGSRSKTDWKLNFTFPVKAYKKQQNKLKYHAGWLKAYKSANDTIMEELIDIVNKYPDYNVEIVGHSLGGALAIYAAEDFNFRTGKQAILITFGAPKAAFGKKTQKRLISSCSIIYQYAHKSDLVPMIPPCYKHLKVTKCGKWSLIKMCKFAYYHTHYDDPEYYS